jgi:hypothetical protein
MSTQPVEWRSPVSVRNTQVDTSAVPDRVRLGTQDWVFLLVLLLLGLAPVLSAYRRSDPPKEDALMLLRYSEHLAQGHGITWNVGEKPVEGATDFLYMVSVACISQFMGLDVIHSAKMLIAVCWTALPLVVFCATRLTLAGDFSICAAVAFYMSAGPGEKFVQSCFGAPVAALAAGLTWWLSNELMYRKPTWPKALGMGWSAIVLGLIRPEAILLGLFMLLAVLLKRPKRSQVIIFGFLVPFATVGLVYFFWRWHYFGYLLPNPFYVKGGGHLYPSGLKRSVGNVSRMLWPAIPIGVLALRSAASRTRLYAIVLPLILFTVIWIFLSNENNHLMRFQFPLVPLVLISLPSLLWGVSEDLKMPQLSDLRAGVRHAVVASAISYVLICAFIFRQLYGPAIDVASGVTYPMAMQKFAPKGYTMAVTEAGQFPFYSKWKAIDALGLNDTRIAHFGISESYLDEYKPMLLMYHLSDLGSFKDFQAGILETGQPVGPLKEDRAVRVMHQYALHHGYILAAAYGDWACNLHVFWVKPGTADTDEIVNYIRNTPYYFLDSGLLSTDYRNNFLRFPCTMQ